MTDRPTAEGGTGSGFVSGELLLIALGSCVIGSLIGAAGEFDLPKSGLTAVVEYVSGDTDGQPDPILITLSVDRPSDCDRAQRLIDVALSGAVGRRLARNSKVCVRFENDERRA